MGLGLGFQKALPVFWVETEGASAFIAVGILLDVDALAHIVLKDGITPLPLLPNNLRSNGKKRAEGAI